MSVANSPKQVTILLHETSEGFWVKIHEGWMTPTYSLDEKRKIFKTKRGAIKHASKVISEMGFEK